MTTRTVNPSTLNAAVEFDSPFRVIDSSTIDDRVPGVYAPSVYGFGNDDGQVTERETIDGNGWEFVDGYSGQQDYSGPVMHPSEQLAGGMAADILDEPGVYAVTVVSDLNDEGDDSAYGWVLLRRVES